MQTNIEPIETIENAQAERHQDENFELKIVDCGTNYTVKDLPSCLSCFCGSGCFCGS